MRTTRELRAALAPERRAGRTIGLVPTMGSLHEGHLSLLRRAREACDVVVMTLFVNPTQFGPREDLAAYPRDEAADARRAEAEGVDVLFAPAVEEVYRAGFATSVEVAGLTDVLCGAPGRRGASHFRGVTTVVAKLLNMAQPDLAWFGQKDFQQALVIRRMARDLDFPVRIEVAPTARDRDGLALSSRNGYLSDDEREQALALKRALDAAAAAIAGGERDPDRVVAAGMRELDSPGVEPEYLEVRSAADLATLERVAGTVVIAAAARVGPARLIDNLVLDADALPARPSSAVHDFALSTLEEVDR